MAGIFQRSFSGLSRNTYSTTFGLLQLVASIVAGLLWDRIGHVAVFYYGAIFGVIGSVGLLILVPAQKCS